MYIGTVVLVVVAALLVALVAFLAGERSRSRFHLQNQKEYVKIIDGLRAEAAKRKSDKRGGRQDAKARRRFERRERDLERIEKIKRSVAGGGSAYELSYLFDLARPSWDEGFLRWCLRFPLAALDLDEAERELERRVGSDSEMVDEEKKRQRDAIWKDLREGWKKEHPNADRAYRRLYEAVYRKMYQFKAIAAHVRQEEATSASDGVDPPRLEGKG